MEEHPKRTVSARAAGRDRPEEKRILERFNAYKLGWLHDSIHFILLVLALFLLFRYGIGFSLVGGDSMSPTLQDGDVVMYLRIVPGGYRVGDIVSMRVPSGDYYIKRIVALGGDTVALSEGRLLVNGEAPEEFNCWGDTQPETATVIYPYAVQEGNVFVLGDNRAVSMDSRAFGEVRLRQIRGKIVLSLNRGGFHRPA